MVSVDGYFGETDRTDVQAMSLHSSRGRSSLEGTPRGYIARQEVPKPMSFLRPMTPYGDSYTPSYTRYLNSPGSSYNHPMHTLFNDRRPKAPAVRTSLYPKQGD